jgi:hypothetical protein
LWKTATTKLGEKLFLVSAFMPKEGEGRQAGLGSPGKQEVWRTVVSYMGFLPNLIHYGISAPIAARFFIINHRDKGDGEESIK